MMMTSEWVDVLDEVDRLASMILQSDLYENLQAAKKAVYTNAELVEKIRAFNDMKERYEEVQRFGRYHPDYQTVMKSIRSMKRELDLEDAISNLRFAENAYQDLLDEISLTLASAVSPSVKVPVSNPFFAQNTGCSTGGCSSGGGCSCSA